MRENLIKQIAAYIAKIMDGNKATSEKEVEILPEMARVLREMINDWAR